MIGSVGLDRSDYEMERPGFDERSLQVFDPAIDLRVLFMQRVTLGMCGEIMIEHSMAGGELAAGVGQVFEDPGLGVPRATRLPAVGGRRGDVQAMRELRP